MPKIKVFLWQLCHNSLPSRGTLFRRGLPMDPLCPACLNDIEDTDHISIHCPLARQVWNLAVAHNWLPQFSFPTLIAPLRDQLHDLATQDYPHITRVVLLLWSIWKSRNALVFNDDASNPMGTLLRAKRSWAEWKLQDSSSSTLSSSSTSTHSPHRLHSTIPHFIRYEGYHSGYY